MPQNWKQIFGVLDGVVIAALTELGRIEPRWETWTQTAVMILGVIGTALGGAQVMQVRAAALAAARARQS